MIAYLNGDFVALEQARISPLDRGFLFADGVYEVIPVFNQRVLALDEHLTRLEKSLAAIQMSQPFSTAEYKKIIARLIQENGDNQSIYLQITRGAYATRDHRMPEKTQPTVFMMSIAMKSLSYDTLKQGVVAITSADRRWTHCDIKSISLLANILAYQEAVSQNAYETILIRDGHVTEGTSSNVFIVKNNTILTPPKNAEILPGITRDIILHVAQKHHISYREEMISAQDLYAADEVWISSSTRGIVPIIKIDDTVLGNGSAGALWEKMYALYHEAMPEFLEDSSSS